MKLHNWIKTIILVGFIIIARSSLFAQCPILEIDRSNWSIHSFDTEETNGEGPNNGRAIHAIDGNNNTFWHTRWQNYTATYPHFIAVDMGEQHDVVGITLTSRFDNAQTKPKSYEFYLSNDGENWNQVQSAGELSYDDPQAPGQITEFSFGAVKAQYFKIVTLSAYDEGVHSAIAEIYAHAIDGSPGCAATGQNNQIIEFTQIPKQYTFSPDFNLVAEVNTNLPISFIVESGPAEINGDMLSLTGQAGTVVITATQVGNDEYYPTSKTQNFEVIDISEIEPEIYTAIPEESTILMPDLIPYKLTARASTDESEVLEIENISFEVNGNMLETVYNGGYFSAWWTPENFGSHHIQITATSSNGMQAQLSRNITVSNDIETTTTPTLQNAVIDWGTIGSQWYYGTYVLPQSVGAFKKITASFDVSCPSVPGGCDDWDRLAYVQIKNRDGNWIELFRYITPYGKPCSHTIDVTDYESVLQGEVEMRVFIDTWGTGGWKMNLNLIYEAGQPEYQYTALQEVWHGTFNFGDYNNLQPIPTKHIQPPTNTEEALFRLVTTGHGWGQNNTGNAAEFYFATHKLKVNGQDSFTQNMKKICNPNPDGCQPQYGTWQYDRAGWCPGSIPAPYFYDLTPFISGDFNFDYEFQTSYVDLCHPNHPDCISGITCPDCNDGYNPHYRISGYIIYKSNSILNITSSPRVETSLTNRLTIYPNPGSGICKIYLEKEMKNPVLQVFDITGASIKTYFFKNSTEFIDKTFDLSNLTPGVYFIKIYNTKEQYTTKFVIQ